jgi:N-acetylglucosamine transport system substrate-binding protein
MTREPAHFDRRTFLRGSLATAALVPLGGTLASCSGSAPSDSGSGDSGGGTKTATNPFGLAKSSNVEAVIFNGGYGYDYVQFAADQVNAQKDFEGVTIKVSPSTQIAQQLQPRFVGGNPPDLVDNSGANAIGFNTVAEQLETLDDVFAANKFIALNYVMTVYGVWYSASLFQKNGWKAPATWDEAIALGAEAKAAGKNLFVWGKEAATYYQTMAVNSAIKEGGDEVRLALENLEPDCWSLSQIQSVFEALAEIVSKGYFVPGGAGTQFTAAQAKWSNDEEAILYPSGGWIENEMKSATKSGFDMTGAPEPTVSSSPTLPAPALRAAAGEPFIVPSQAANVAGGKEILRAMLSKDAATNFSKTRLAPTIVKDLVPADGFGSTALVSQTKMLDAAGSDTFNYQFVDYYGMNTDQLVVWNSFLSGQTDVAGLTKGLQDITDKVANDSSVKKLTVT